MSRVCACPCERSLDGMKPSALYATNACRTRHYRERKLGDAQTPRVTSQRRSVKPSGLQVSFWKAQKALEQWLEEYVRDVPAARNLSLRILEDALSDKQRDELHARKRAKRAPSLTVAEQRDRFERQEAA